MPNHKMSALEAAVQSSIEATQAERAEHKRRLLIEDYWRARGVEVSCTVELTEDGVTLLRSNLAFRVPT